MRKVILNLAVSLDGYIARPDGDVDFLENTSPELGDFFQAFLDKVDTIIMGRSSYEKTISFGDYPFGNMKNYILSTKTQKNEDNIEYTSKDIDDLLADIRKKDGKGIWLFGGGKTIKSFIEKDCIDEFYITIVPEIIGDGIPLFQPSNKNLSLKLKDVVRINDTVTLIYERK